MLLITGGTGTIGRELLPILQSKGVPFRVLVRKEATLKELKGKGVDAVLGDLSQPKTYGKALGGIERLFLLTNPTPEVVTLEGNLLEAATKAGVRRVVRLSAMGANPWGSSPLARAHGQCEAQLETSGLDWTILRPTMFMQNLAPMYAETVAKTSTLFAPAGEARIPFVDTRDIAAVAALTLTSEGHSGLVYEITGSEAVSYNGLAGLLSAKLGRVVKYVDVPDDAAFQAMVNMGMSPWLSHGLITLFHLFKANGATAVPLGTVARLTGRAPRTLNEYIGEQLHRFHGAKAESMAQ
jgi:uncharacterized protein YbjT (DUF2867 family)